MKTVFICSLITVFRTRSALILTALVLCTLALVQRSKALNPPPDGGYAGGNTAEGQGALLNLASGTFNTAVGLFSLRNNAQHNFNTAIGAGSLFANTADDNTAIGAALFPATPRVHQTQQMERSLFFPILVDRAITPLVILRFSATPLVAKTQPPAISRSVKTQPVATIPPTAPARLIPTRPATATRQAA